MVFPEKTIMAAMVPEDKLPLEGEVIQHWRFPCMRRGWYTAALAVGQVYKNRCYVIDAHQGYYKPSLLARMVVNTARIHYLHRVSVEDAPGARLMETVIRNESLVRGWPLSLDWVGKEDSQDENAESNGERDLRIRNLEAVIASGRLLFNRQIKQMRKLIYEFCQYSMIPDIAFPDVISRVAEHLPQSIAIETLENEKLTWQQARERDFANLVFGRGPYAPPEPEPEPRHEIEDDRFTEEGLEIWMPGLE